MHLTDISFGREYGPQIADTAGVVFNPLGDMVIARVTPEGKLLGGVVFTQYTGQGGSIGMHVAGFEPRWISKSLLWACFWYPFEQLGVKKVFGTVPAFNARALAFNRKLGFRQEAVIRDVYPDGDMVLMAMYREECRHLTMKPLPRGQVNGWKEQGTATAATASAA